MLGMVAIFRAERPNEPRFDFQPFGSPVVDPESTNFSWDTVDQHFAFGVLRSYAQPAALWRQTLLVNYQSSFCSVAYSCVCHCLEIVSAGGKTKYANFVCNRKRNISKKNIHIPSFRLVDEPVDHPTIKGRIFLVAYGTWKAAAAWEN